MDTGSKASGLRANEILNSLHLSGFRTTLILRDHSINSLVIPWALLAFPFWITSEAVVSSTNIQKSGDLISKSLIIITNNHGPNLVPCGATEGTGPHSEKQPSANLMRWNLSERKSIIQFTTLQDISNLHSLSIKILWSA